MSRDLAPLPDVPVPQLATLAGQAPEGEDWLHEIKFDGYRLMARLEGGDVRLYVRNGKDWSHRFPEIADALKRLPLENGVMDGEVVCLTPSGVASFGELQAVMAGGGRARRQRLGYQAFDLLHLNGYDLRQTPLVERKSALARLLAGTGHPLHYSDHVRGQGPAFFQQVCELGLEGMIAKAAASVYRPGRQRSWLKVKCIARDEFVVGGFTPPGGARAGFGALLLGAFGREGLIYVGRVGAGFSREVLSRLHRRLSALEIEASPFASDVPSLAGVRWVEPSLVVEVTYTERTAGGLLRHPVFHGIREDKPASEVVLEPATEPMPPKPSPKEAGQPPPDNRPRRRLGRGEAEVAGVRLTNAGRLLYPDAGITKLELARYYEAVQDWIMPGLINRPLALVRCPEGWDRECFFQKHPGKNFAAGVSRVAIAGKSGRERPFLYLRSLGNLIELVQFNVLEIHPWGSLVKDVEAPDTLVFDLDPGPQVPWGQMADTAQDLREQLAALGLTAFLQITGGTGLHLVVPIQPTVGWDQAKAFAREVSRICARQDPARRTIRLAKAEREGRIFIDYLRNGRGATAIARYSTRAKGQAPVATPLRWEELRRVGNASRYHPGSIRRRLGALKEDPWQGFDQARAAIALAGMGRP